MLFDDTCEFPVGGWTPSGWVTAAVLAEHGHYVMPLERFTQARWHLTNMADVRAGAAAPQKHRCCGRIADAGATGC